MGRDAESDVQRLRQFDGAGEASMEVQHLRLENTWLKDELDRLCTITEKFIGRPSLLPTAAAIFPSLPLNSPPIMGVGEVDWVVDAARDCIGGHG